MSKSKLFLCVALALTGALGTGVAQAGTSQVQWSIVIGMPVHLGPVPVQVRPLPVYRQSAPRSVHLKTARWDRDGDGIPNHRDRLYNPPWDRDGDGIPNRRDRQPDRGRHGR